MIRIILTVLLFLFLFFIYTSPVFASSVVINEFQVAPKQWIELYNNSDGTIDITGWIIDDNGGSEKYTISQDTFINSHKCISFESGKFNWNTSTGDSIRLFDGDILIEEYVYSAGQGQDISIGRINDGEGELTVLTSSSRDKFNSSGGNCLTPPTPSPTPTPTPSSSPSPSPTQKTASSPTPTPTPRRTPSPTPQITPSSAGKILATGTSLVLGETESSAAATTEAVLAAFESRPAAPEKETKILPRIILILAGLSILAMVFSAFWLRKKKPV